MPDSEIDIITKEWLQQKLRTITTTLNDIIILDCRSSNEYTEGHIRSAVNFSIPSIMLRRLAAGKIDITTTIKCRELKARILTGYNDSLFVLYNESNITNNKSTNNSITSTGIGSGGGGSSGGSTANNNTSDGTINVLHRRLKQDGCRVVCLEGKKNLFFFYILLL